ncbi:hypothetical protein [Rarobacter incanus]|uniref:hypothetical protein n=1 Tax=Rarobacter incanus TaxID=153494 RepID=UPI0011505879|nr:hypothetical protein [Rarobacter incanus]
MSNHSHIRAWSTALGIAGSLLALAPAPSAHASNVASNASKVPDATAAQRWKAAGGKGIAAFKRVATAVDKAIAASSFGAGPTKI